MEANEELSKWIKENMTVDDSAIIGENKEAVARLVGLTSDGKVILKVDKANLTGKQAVLLYLLGKLFSKVAGYSVVKTAQHSEIHSELGMPSGTVGRCLMELRKQGYVRDGQDGGNELVMSAIPSILNAFKEGAQNV